ncbi:MAG: 50S ribosomal protein L23 [Chloroflexi bacterium]|nr:50S ribosomal protein L23 [Chloroflexota bacterium]|tara:strand:+ start:69243 stop:69536 length:294 start_codon:yes stop_codon:yes gene_type:complete
MDHNSYNILRKPVVTEKSTLIMESSNRYTFEVLPSATKLQIKNAVQQAFGVDVVQVNTMNVRGKRKRYGPRFSIKPSRKKAIVTIADGQSITIFEGV